ncbi:uncharacterized protein LOC126823798 isoform X2 [Patella vulgata]|uniref:uncharacterized protein LOC126823798 isoform X2 n=1 Tax=Patella vulgata TaxID=6465 RepID=UPI0021802D29|nr:uncharacterized protein LOC126823798 isoform X2 [Patella vulgata]
MTTRLKKKIKTYAGLFLSVGFFVFGVYHLIPCAAVSNKRTFVYTCKKGVLCGGWADRQKGLIAVYLLANATQSGFKIEIDKPCDVTSFLQPKSRDWRLEKDKTKNLCTEESAYIDGYGRELRQNLKTKNISDFFNKDINYLTINSEFSHYIRQNKLYSHSLNWLKRLSMGQIFATIWQENMALTADLKRIYKNFIKRTDGRKLVCAQVRIGRNPSIPSDTVIRNDIDHVIKILDFFRKYDDPKLFRIFVTTDAEQVRVKVKQSFPDVVIDTEGVIAHVDREQDQKKSCEGFRKVILDQHILSTCNVLVISYSGVGRHAAWIRGTPTDLFCFIGGNVIPCNFTHDMFQPSIW